MWTWTWDMDMVAHASGPFLILTFITRLETRPLRGHRYSILKFLTYPVVPPYMWKPRLVVAVRLLAYTPW